MTHTTLQASLLVGIGAALLVVGSYAASRELAPFLSSSGTERSKVAAYAVGVERGISIQAQTSYLMDCNLVLNSIAGRAQPTAVRERVIENCLTGAEDIAASSPTHSLAWLVGAMANGFQRDAEQFRTKLKKSYETAPNEQWIAEIRVDLIHANVALLDEALHRLHEADVRLLLSTPTGRGFLAPRYASWSTIRGDIDGVLETVPERQKERFLRTVRRL